MRLFIAIPFPDRIKDILAAQGEALQQACGRGNYTRRDNFHLTLQFLGEYPAAACAPLTAALTCTAQKHSPFSLTIAGLGAFPKGKEAIVWAGINQGKGALITLFRTLEKELVQAGFPPAAKPLSPHITLGRRIHLVQSIEELNRSLPDLQAKFEVTSIALFVSERNQENQLVYRILSEVLLP